MVLVHFCRIQMGPGVFRFNLERLPLIVLANTLSRPYYLVTLSNTLVTFEFLVPKLGGGELKSLHQDFIRIESLFTRKFDLSGYYPA